MSSNETDAAKVSHISEQAQHMLARVSQDLEKAVGKEAAVSSDEKKYFVYDVRYCMPCPALLYLCHSHEISRLLHC